MNTAYVVLKFSNPDKLIPAVEQIESSSSVESWDAVEGHAELILRIRCGAAGLPEDVLKIDGLKQFNTYPIADGEVFPPTPKPLPIRAYLFIDTDPEQKESVREALLAMPETISCARVNDICDLVAMVKGSTLGALKSTIGDSIRRMDGILRIRTDYAFNIKEL
jgi:DNA-binding Lrp family transcriptional regulator